MSAELTALMTTYNSASFIADAIDSILVQSFTNFELLILDDGSSDNTVQIIKQYDDPRIRLIENQKNEGVGFRLNQALDLITSPYIVKTDADDISFIRRFELQLRYLKTSGADIIKCYVDYFTDSSEVAVSERFIAFKETKQDLINSIDTRNKIHKELPRWPCFMHASYMAKTNVVKQVGYPCIRIFEDYGMFNRLLANDFIFDCVPEYLLRFRVSDTSLTATIDNKQLDEGMSALVEIKWPSIQKLVQSGTLFIYGSGGGARSLKRVLLEKNINVHGFIEGNKSSDLDAIEGVTLFTLNEVLSQYNKPKFIVAAQPVRAHVCDILNQNAMHEWQDYMVIN